MTKPDTASLVTSFISAGFTSPAEEGIDQSLDLNSYLVPHPAATFFVRVNGHSMEGAGIFSGDLLIVDRSLEATSGKIVVAVVAGEFTVKRLLKRSDKILLVAEHEDFPPLEISPESDFQVWGVVTYVIHNAK
jgi:DNA polymerase V